MTSRVDTMIDRAMNLEDDELKSLAAYIIVECAKKGTPFCEALFNECRELDDTYAVEFLAQAQEYSVRQEL